MKFPNLSDYLGYARKQMDSHGLHHWKVRWMDIPSVRVCGRCRSMTKVIELNRDYFYLTNDHNVLINTVLHEAAHGINAERGGAPGHSQDWRNIFLALGGNGARLNSDAVMPTIGTRRVSENRPSFILD